MDRLTAMQTYVDVVETGSFTAAARRSGRTKARVSQTVTALEERLGVVLLQRTTRSSRLTEVGHRYYQKCVELLAEVESLESSVRGARQTLRGALRITAPPGLASQFLAPLTTDFAEQHPEVSIDLQLTHRRLDLVEEGIDVAIRVTDPVDSSLIGRKLMPAPLVAVTSPMYLEKHGPPRRPEDLRHHACLVDTNFREQQRWRFHGEGGQETVSVSGPFRVNSPNAIRDLAAAGWGIAIVPKFLADPHLRDGTLVEVLRGRVALNWTVFALYPRRDYLPERVRAYLDHLSSVFRDPKAGEP